MSWSTGRGGAGNMIDGPSTSKPDLVTPTIKSKQYTTGRGGQGNMQANVDEESTRASQDVRPYVRRDQSRNEAFIGRGGAANTAKVPTKEQDDAQQANVKTEKGAFEQRKSSFTGLGLRERVKDMLEESKAAIKDTGASKKS